MIEAIIAYTMMAFLFGSIIFMAWTILAHSLEPLEKIMYKKWFFVLANIINFVTFTSWTTLIIMSYVLKILMDGKIYFIIGNVGLLFLMGSYIHSYRTHKGVV